MVPEATVMVKLPSMSVAVPEPFPVAGTMLAPISGSESVAEITVPWTVRLCAFMVIAANRSNIALRIDFFMFSIVVELLIFCRKDMYR
jgi:hypothetical protein